MQQFIDRRCDLCKPVAEGMGRKAMALSATFTLGQSEEER